MLKIRSRKVEISPFREAGSPRSYSYKRRGFDASEELSWGLMDGERDRLGKRSGEAPRSILVLGTHVNPGAEKPSKFLDLLPQPFRVSTPLSSLG